MGKDRGLKGANFGALRDKLHKAATTEKATHYSPEDIQEAAKFLLDTNPDKACKKTGYNAAALRNFWLGRYEPDPLQKKTITSAALRMGWRKPSAADMNPPTNG